MTKIIAALTKIRMKITLLALSLVLVSSAVVMGVFLNGIIGYRSELEKQIEHQIHVRVQSLTTAMYRLCEVVHKASILQRQHALTIMGQLMEKQGTVVLGRDREWVHSTDPQGNTARVQIPRMVLGGRPLQLNFDPGLPSPVVDEMLALTGYHSSIMVRMNPEGDFVRVATSVVRDGERQVGFVLPARKADGSFDPFTKALMDGKSALGRTYVEDYVFVSTAQPLRGPQGQIIGCYGVGIRQDLMENLRRVLMDTPVGNTGYFVIIGAKGKQRGRYILSHKGQRDGEYIWDIQSGDGSFPAREVFERSVEQTPGQVVWYTYQWKNPGEAEHRQKYAAMIYFEPWEWIVGASAYREDFSDSSEQLGHHLETIVFKVVGASLIVLLISAFACWLLGRQISRPLNRAVEFADAISQGRFPPPLQIRTRDETGHLAETLNIMGQTLETNLGDLQQAKKDLKTLYDSSRDALLLIENGVFIDCNQAAVTIFGVGAKDEILGRPPECLSPETQPSGERSSHIARQKLEETRSLGASRFEWCHSRPDGQVFFAEVQLSAMEIGGRPMIMAAVRDISLRKDDEAQLIRLRSYLSNIIGSMPSALVVVDRGYKVTLWNRMAEKTWEIMASQAKGEPLFRVLPGFKQYHREIEAAMTGGEVQKVSKSTRKTPKGAVHEDIIVYPLISDGIDGAVIRIDDVSNRVKMEEMIIQSEKMMSVGGLAAGMAHEINNPLAGMIQGAQVVGNRLAQDLPANTQAALALGISFENIRAYAKSRGILDLLESVRTAGDRAARIVDNMLSFSRSQPLMEAHHPGDLLDRTLELAQNDYDLKKQFDFKNIKIVRDYDSRTPCVRCEASQIQQVFFNIFKNGAQAMAGIHSPCFSLKTWAEESMACISIEDNGPGMDGETRKRVFEPFFTTKSVGSGTGLGLSVSFFIVTQNHAGGMSVDTSPGQGCRFTIKLPAQT